MATTLKIIPITWHQLPSQVLLSIPFPETSGGHHLPWTFATLIFQPSDLSSEALKVFSLFFVLVMLLYIIKVFLGSNFFEMILFSLYIKYCILSLNLNELWREGKLINFFFFWKALNRYIANGNIF